MVDQKHRLSKMQRLIVERLLQNDCFVMDYESLKNDVSQAEWFAWTQSPDFKHMFNSRILEGPSKSFSASFSRSIRTLTSQHAIVCWKRRVPDETISRGYYTDYSVQLDEGWTTEESYTAEKMRFIRNLP